MHALDQQIFHWINGWPEAVNPLFHFFSEATKLTVVRILLVLLTGALIAIGGKPRRAAILGLASVCLANPTTDVLKNAFQMLRPCVEISDAIIRVNDGKPLTSFGTASAHSANMMALAVVFWYTTGWKGGAPWLIVALVTGLARIYVGVHYPSQVLFGWFTGAVCAMIVLKTWEAVEKRRAKPENEG